jgi:phage gp29-like protein
MGLRQRIQAFRDAGKQPVIPIGAPAELYIPLYQNPTWAVPNVDDLVAKKGLVVYRDMETDDQVASCLGLLKLARLASGTKLSPASGDEIDKQVHATIQHSFDVLKGSSITRILMDGMDAINIGFSVQEKIWSEPITTGDFTGKQLYRTVRALPQETIAFKRDEYGDLEADGLWQVKPRQMLPPGLDPAFYNKLPIERFIIWSWRKRWDNPLGMSVLRSAYPWYEFKKFTLKHWANYTERYGLPRGLVQVPTTATPEQMAEAVEIGRRYRSDMFIAYKAGAKPEFTEASTSVTMNFEANILASNKAIAHSCFMPPTILDTNDGGSYALAKAQKATFEWVLSNLGELLKDELIEEAYMRPLVDHNFGTEIDCPIFEFCDYSQPDRESIARMYQILIMAGVTISRKEIGEALGIREPEDEEDRVVPPSIPTSPQTPAGPVFPPAVSAEEAALNAMIADLADCEGDHDSRVDVLCGNGKRTRLLRING